MEKINVVFDMEDQPPQLNEKIRVEGVTYKILDIKPIGIGNTWDEYELTVERELK